MPEPGWGANSTPSNELMSIGLLRSHKNPNLQFAPSLWARRSIVTYGKCRTYNVSGTNISWTVSDRIADVDLRRFS